MLLKKLNKNSSANIFTSFVEPHSNSSVANSASEKASVGDLKNEPSLSKQPSQRKMQQKTSILVVVNPSEEQKENPKPQGMVKITSRRNNFHSSVQAQPVALRQSRVFGSSNSLSALKSTPQGSGIQSEMVQLEVSFAAEADEYKAMGGKQYAPTKFMAAQKPPIKKPGEFNFKTQQRSQIKNTDFKLQTLKK